MKALSLVIATRKVEDNWEGAVISDGRFMKALIGKDLYSLVTKQIVGFLANEREEGTEVSIKIDVTKSETKEDGQ